MFLVSVQLYAQFFSGGYGTTSILCVTSAYMFKLTFYYILAVSKQKDYFFIFSFADDEFVFVKAVQSFSPN